VWPLSPEEVWRGVKDFSKDEIDKITHGNAMHFYSYDPFPLLGRENCTVGALRAQAAAKGVDTSEQASLGGLAPKWEPGKPITSGDVQKMLSTV
jgi:hypothetical protein